MNGEYQGGAAVRVLRRIAAWGMLLGVAGLLSACGGGGGGSGGAGTSQPAYRSIGGLVSGLAGSVVLQDNGGDNLTVASNGSFTFPTTVLDGKPYNVTVLTQPTGQTCSVSAGAGTVSGANVANVAVVCSANSYSVGGTVSGLSGSVVLQDNNGDNLTVSASGAFTFATKVASGSAYNVTVLTQPAGQVCSVTAGTGTIAAANVTNAVVTCATNTYGIGGTISGLSGSVVLQNNGGNNLTVAANGAFTFPAAIPYGLNYSVTVLTQPSGQTCTVSTGAGTVAGNVGNVAVTCTNNSYTVGGSAIGLAGSVVLQNNGGDNLTVAANGPFTFATPIVNGSAYNVTVLTQPVGQTCTVSTGAGTVSGSNVGNVVVVCSANSYSVGGTVSGLTGSLVLQDNNGDNLTLAANGTFTFATKVANGSPYNVTVLTQPAGQSCSVTAGTGAIATANVANVAVTCVAGIYTIGGSVSGLNGSVTLLLNNGLNGVMMTVATNGAFTFPLALPYGAIYSVSVLAQSAGQTCFPFGSGTVTGNVTNIAVICTNTGYTVGGSVSGLAGSVVLQDNGGDNITLTANGAFTFLTPVLNGNPYKITVLTQPAGQICTVTNGTGTIFMANVTSATVTCGAPFSVGGTITGLTGSMVLQNNGGDNFTVAANGAFTFVTPVANGAPYNASVFTPPTGQNCTVANGAGTIAGANITNIAIACATNTYTIGGTVSGLSGSMVLQNNGADNLTIAANGAFTFATAVPYGNAYNVTLSSLQNPNQTCTITGGTGTAMANVANVAVACVPLAISSVSPTSVTMGGQPFTLTVLGTGYLPTSVVQWNGTPRTTTYVSPTEVLAQITAADIAATGTASVTVANAGPPAGATNAASVAIVPPSKDAVAFQLDTAHTGVINFNAVALPTVPKWSVNLGGAPSYALIAAGKIFVTVHISSTNSSQLVALDQATGATVWGPIALAGLASAAYDSGVVFVTNSTVTSPVLAQAFDAATGQSKWSVAIPGPTYFSPPTAANGLVYANANGNLYAFNPITGGVAWIKPVWNGNFGAPAVSADGVYGAFPCQTYSFRPSTGESIWHNNTGCTGGGGATPVLANGVLYVPSGMTLGYSGSTLTAETGAVLGSYVADNPPAIGSQTGYFLQNGTLRGISLATNTVLWSFAGDGFLVTSPIVVNNFVFVGSSAGNLYALDAATGAQLWTTNMGAAIPSGASYSAVWFSALSAGNGLLVVPAGNTLTAYTLSTAP